MKDIKINKYSIKSMYLSIFIFLILYITSGYTTRITSGTVQIGILSLLALTILLTEKKIKINNRLFFSVLIMLITVIISSTVNSDSYKNMFIMIVIILISALIVIEIDFNDFSDAYVKVMYLTAIYSLVVYVLSIFLPNFIRLFPSTYARAGRETYNLFLSVSNLNFSPMRNMGFFWEPGAYQTFLTIAIVLEMFYVRKNTKKRLIILGFTLVSTLSTTGIIAGILTFLLYILSKKSNVSDRIFKMMIILVTISVTFFISYPYLPESIRYATLGKFSGIFTKSTDVSVSTTVRFGSVFYPLKDLIKSPLLGLGSEGLYNTVKINTGYSLATNTPVNWMATYGVFFGTVCYYGVFRFSKILTSFWFTRVIIIMTLFITLSSQQYIGNSVILIFVYYGITEDLNNKQKYKEEHDE